MIPEKSLNNMSDKEEIFWCSHTVRILKLNFNQGWHQDLRQSPGKPTDSSPINSLSKPALIKLLRFSSVQLHPMTAAFACDTFTRKMFNKSMAYAAYYMRIWYPYMIFGIWYAHLVSFFESVLWINGSSCNHCDQHCNVIDKVWTWQCQAVSGILWLFLARSKNFEPFKYEIIINKLLSKLYF